MIKRFIEKLTTYLLHNQMKNSVQKKVIKSCERFKLNPITNNTSWSVFLASMPNPFTALLVARIENCNIHLLYGKVNNLENWYLSCEKRNLTNLPLAANLTAVQAIQETIEKLF